MRILRFAVLTEVNYFRINLLRGFLTRFRDLNFRITHQYSGYDKGLVLKILHDLRVLFLVTPRKIYSLRAVPCPYLLQPLFVVQLDDVEDKI